jgi:hypothetical protein
MSQNDTGEGASDVDARKWILGSRPAPVHNAALGCHTSTCEALAEMGADVGAVDGYQDAPIAQGRVHLPGTDQARSTVGQCG